MYYVIHAALKVETFTHRGLSMRPSCSGQLSYHPISSETTREVGALFTTAWRAL